MRYEDTQACESPCKRISREGKSLMQLSHNVIDSIESNNYENALYDLKMLKRRCTTLQRLIEDDLDRV